MIVEIPYKPHDSQLKIHNNDARYKILVCGRRFGKTVFAINELLKQALLKKGTYWYVAPTYRQAKRIAWQGFKKYVIKEIVKKINETELILTLKNGSRIELIGVDRDPNTLRGVGLNGVVIDEFATIKRGVWSEIIQPSLADNKGWAIFTGTPKGKNNHFYEFFLRDITYNINDYTTLEGYNIHPNADYKSFIFKTIDNPYIDSNEIEKVKNDLPDDIFRQEYEASFETYSGLIYKELKDIHIIQPIALKPFWNIYIGIDTGRHTAITFIAVDENGIMYVFDEIYNFDGIVAHIAQEIKNKLAKWNIKQAIYIIDSASQVKQEYLHNGIIIQDAKKNVENQINLVRIRLHQNKLFFFNTCIKHILEHKSYQWKEFKGVFAPVKEADHTCNSLQYVLSTYQTTKAFDNNKYQAYKKTLEYEVFYGQEEEEKIYL